MHLCVYKFEELTHSAALAVYKRANGDQLGEEALCANQAVALNEDPSHFDVSETDEANGCKEEGEYICTYSEGKRQSKDNTRTDNRPGMP